MSESSTEIKTSCPKCGKPLVSAQAPQGLCPSCLMGQVLEPTQTHGDESAALPTLTPEELAPYFPQLEILECFGRGGMGVVYKARQKSLNRWVALKLLAPERVGDLDFAVRFEREAQALARLNHPHIVAVHDFGETQGFYYLIMEFVDGVNLRQLIQARRLSPKEALAIVPPVCEALQCAHEHGIVHRDIKPENLLVDKEGRVKITDFGIAKMVTGDEAVVDQESVTSATRGMGTPAYAAPEAKEQGTVLDHRADIYSLGVVLYELLTGERPSGNLEPPSRKVQVDIRIDEIVLQALEASPELRFPTAAAFRTQVETVAAAMEGGRGEERPKQPGAARKGRRSVMDLLAGSPAISEALQHLTPAERREVALLGGMFTVWNVVTCFLPVFIGLIWMPHPTGWMAAGLVLVAGLLGYPLWRKLHLLYLCSTAWGKERRMTPSQLVGGSSEKAARRKARVLAVLIFFGVAVAAQEISVAMGWSRSSVMGALAGLVLMFAVFEGWRMRRGAKGGGEVE